METLKNQWVGIIAIVFLGIAMLFGGGGDSIVPGLGSHTEVTSITNPIVFNQNGEDIDYRFEGDSDTALLVTDASTDRVGISVLAPTDTLDVDGTADVSGTTTVGRFTQGGGTVTLTDASGGAFTLTQAQMFSNVISFAAGGAGQGVITLTFPASSTMTTIMPNSGDSASWLYSATLLDAATTTTFVSGAGMTIKEPTGGNIVVAGAEQAMIQCWRLPDTDIICFATEGQPI